MRPKKEIFKREIPQIWRRVTPEEVANFKNLKFDKPVGSIHCDGCGTTHFIYADMIKKWMATPKRKKK